MNSENNKKPDVQRAQFNDYFQLYIQPLHHQAFEAQRYAVEYAQIAVRSSYLLNGGALVAIPAYVSLFGNEFHRSTLHLAAGIFVLGLLLIVICTVACHVNFYNAIGTSTDHAYKAANQAYRNFYEPNTQADVDVLAEIKAFDEGIARKGRWIGRTFRIAWISGISSYMTFLFGCWLLARSASVI